MASARLNLSNTRILAVDDNPQAMEILSQILLGFAVDQPAKFLDAEEAMAKIATTTFNLMIIDDDMPGMSGYDMIAAIRREATGRNYTAPIILVCANPTKAVVRQARDCGANLVVGKPIVPGVLLSRIQWLARNPRAFVTSDCYRGPDRRFSVKPLPEGVEERRIEMLRLLATSPERTLSQDEINSLF